MDSVILTTLNAKYQHTAFGLRYIYSNMGSLKSETQICEFTINQNIETIAQNLLSKKPSIIGFGVYIWNVEESCNVIEIIKKVSPQTKVIVGGPEVSYETKSFKGYELVDHIICGEADFEFSKVCKKIMSQDYEELQKIISTSLPAMDQLVLPYNQYSDEDIKNRIIYVEASRGCPFKCSYCLSSLDKKVRDFDIDLLLTEFDQLVSRGARHFKFVDRTFNLKSEKSLKILDFFLSHIDKEIYLHFEMVPDRFPDEIREAIKRFPKGRIQFEIGIQTINPVTAKIIQRRQNLDKVKENLNYIKSHTGVHTHADLIFGLPEEDIESFAKGFDWLYSLKPDEIQVGILKRLKGTPITLTSNDYEMKFQSIPPYSILSHSRATYFDIQTIRFFSKFWDKYGNTGKFKNFISKLESISIQKFDGSFFKVFLNFCLFLQKKVDRDHSISLENLAKYAFFYMIEELKVSKEEAKDIIKEDYLANQGRRCPDFLKDEKKKLTKRSLKPFRRQEVHLN